MFFYYQTVNDGKQKWLKEEEANYDEVKVLSAKHATITFMDREHDGITDVTYKGDMWFDIDNPRPDKAECIAESIASVRKIQELLIGIGVDLAQIGLYISGGKGFHIRIPAECLGAVPLPKLPMVYKRVAQEFEHRTKAQGIDYQIYCMGQGKLLRVENHQRIDGFFKVPIHWSEMDKMDVERYYNLAGSPKPLIVLDAPKENRELCIMFNDALRESSKAAKRIVVALVTDDEFESLNGNSPECINNISEHKNIKSRSGAFNKACMTMANYLNSCQLSDREKDDLRAKFCDNFPSKKFPTVSARLAQLRYAENSLSGGSGFDCAKVVGDMQKFPCNHCPVRVARAEATSATSGVFERDGRFQIRGKTEKDPSIPISNFTLAALTESYELSEDGTRQSNHEYTFSLIYANKNVPPELATVRLAHLTTKSLVVSHLLSGHPQATFTGSDNHAMYLKELITNPERMKLAKRIIPMKKVGVLRVIDTQQGVDENVWVQKGWSVNAEGIPNTVVYRGMNVEGEMGAAAPCLNLQDIPAVETAENAQVFKALSEARGLTEMTILMGWVASCWVKSMLTDEGYDSVFPVLHIFGEAGCGKTTLAQAVTCLAAADFITSSRSAVVVSNSTVFAMMQMCTASTTVPTIFDEVNPAKMLGVNQAKYRGLAECIKSVGTKGAMMKGKVIGSGGSSQTVTEITVCSTPLIILATTMNNEAEIKQRCVLLKFNKSDVDPKNLTDTKYKDAYEIVSKNKRALIPYTRMLMEQTIRLTPEEVRAMYDNTKWVENTITDSRRSKGIRCIGVGLQLMLSAFKRANVCQETIGIVEKLLNEGVKSYLEHELYSALYQDDLNEADTVMSYFITMAVLDDERGSGNMIKEGLHYIVDGTLVHIKINAVFVKFLELAKRQGWMVEFSSAAGFIQGVKTADYYKGFGTAAGVKTPHEWHAFSIPGLKEKKLNVENFFGSK